MSLSTKQKQEALFQNMEDALIQIESTMEMIADMGCKGSDETTVSATDVQQFCWMIAGIAKQAREVQS